MPPAWKSFQSKLFLGRVHLDDFQSFFCQKPEAQCADGRAGMCFVGAAIAAETGGLRITISGSDGQPIPGATVSVSSPDSLVSKTAVTAADGSVRLTGLDPATNYRSEEHTSELQSLMRISYAVFCLKKKKEHKTNTTKTYH